jgi:hypothetical protein
LPSEHSWALFGTWSSGQVRHQACGSSRTPSWSSLASIRFQRSSTTEWTNFCPWWLSDQAWAQSLLGNQLWRTSSRRACHSRRGPRWRPRISSRSPDCSLASQRLALHARETPGQ